MLRSSVVSAGRLSRALARGTSAPAAAAFSTSARAAQATPSDIKMIKLTVDGKEVEVPQGCVSVPTHRPVGCDELSRLWILDPEPSDIFPSFTFAGLP